MAAERETRTTTASPAVAVRLDGVRKEFGGVTAVDSIDFEVFEGRPEVNVVASVVLLASVVPVYLAQRLARGTVGVTRGGVDRGDA